MSETPRVPVPSGIMSLVRTAFAQGVARVQITRRMPAFGLMLKADNKAIAVDFAADSASESLEFARRAVATTSPPNLVAYAICHDGYVTMGGVRTDALFCEAARRGDEMAHVFVQRYRPKGFLRKFRTLGEPVVLPGVPNRWAAQGAKTGAGPTSAPP